MSSTAIPPHLINSLSYTPNQHEIPHVPATNINLPDDLSEFFNITTPNYDYQPDYVATTLRIQITSSILHHSNSNAVLLAEMLTNLASARVCDAYLYAYTLFVTKQYDLTLLVLKRYGLSVDFIGLQQLVSNYTPPPTLDTGPGSLHRSTDTDDILSFVSVHDLVVCMILSMRCLIALERFEEAISFLGHGRSPTAPGTHSTSMHMAELIDNSCELESVLLSVVKEHYYENYHLVNTHTFWSPITEAMAPITTDDAGGSIAQPYIHYPGMHQPFISGLSLMPQTFLHTISQLCLLRAGITTEAKKKLYYTSKAFFYDIYNITAFKSIVDMEVLSSVFIIRLLKQVYTVHKTVYRHTQLIPRDFAPLYGVHTVHHPPQHNDPKDYLADRLEWVLHLYLSIIKSKSHIDLDIYAARNKQLQNFQDALIENADDTFHPNTKTYDDMSIYPPPHRPSTVTVTPASVSRPLPNQQHHQQHQQQQRTSPQQVEEDEDIFDKLCGIQYHMAILEADHESRGIGNNALILSCQAETFFRQHVIDDAYKLAEFVTFKHDLVSTRSLVSTHSAEVYSLICFELNYVKQLYILCVCLCNVVPDSPILWFCVVVFFLATGQYANAKALLEGSSFLLAHPRVLMLSSRLHFDVRHNDIAIMALKQANLSSPAASWHLVSLITYQLHDIYHAHIDGTAIRVATIRHGCKCHATNRVCVCSDAMITALNNPEDYVTEYYQQQRAKGVELRDIKPIPSYTLTDCRLCSSIDLNVWALCGLIAYKQQRYDEALQWFDKALDITQHLTQSTLITPPSDDPDDDGTADAAATQVIKPRMVSGHLTLLINKAHAYRKLHRYWDAIDTYSDAVSLCSHPLQSSQCYLGIAMSYHLIGRISEALQSYHIAHSLDPSNSVTSRLLRICSYTLARN